MTRVVLDANVYISALHFRGQLISILDRIFQGDIRLISSERIRKEVEEALAWKFAWSPAQIRDLRDLWAKAEFLEAVLDTGVCRDPKDDHVLAICQRGDAQFLVTGDKDLLVLEQFGQTRIVSPKRFSMESNQY